MKQFIVIWKEQESFMAVRKGLGRGLDLLIPKDEGMPKKSIEKNKENKEPKENQVLTLSIHDVEPNRNQPRKQFDEDAIEELADSIKQYGVIQPLIVQKKISIMKSLLVKEDGEHVRKPD